MSNLFSSEKTKLEFITKEFFGFLIEHHGISKTLNFWRDLGFETMSITYFQVREVFVGVLGCDCKYLEHHFDHYFLLTWWPIYWLLFRRQRWFSMKRKISWIVIIERDINSVGKFAVINNIFSIYTESYGRGVIKL